MQRKLHTHTQTQNKTTTTTTYTKVWQILRLFDCAIYIVLNVRHVFVLYRQANVQFFEITRITTVDHKAIELAHEAL